MGYQTSNTSNHPSSITNAVLLYCILPIAIVLLINTLADTNEVFAQWAVVVDPIQDYDTIGSATKEKGYKDSSDTRGWKVPLVSVGATSNHKGVENDGHPTVSKAITTNPVGSTITTTTTSRHRTNKDTTHRTTSRSTTHDGTASSSSTVSSKQTRKPQNDQSIP